MNKIHVVNIVSRATNGDPFWLRLEDDVNEVAEWLVIDCVSKKTEFVVKHVLREITSPIRDTLHRDVYYV